MQYTVRHKGRVIGTTALDLYQLIHGQHSGWLIPEPGAEDMLDAVSIKSAWLRNWMIRDDKLADGRSLTEPDFVHSRKGQAITIAVAARLHLVLTLHREDGSEIPTREIVVQDRDYGEGEIDDEDYEELDEDERAEIEAAVEHDYALIQEWRRNNAAELMETMEEMDDEEWRKHMEARWAEDGESRYQVHLRLTNPEDVPSDLAWLAEEAT